MITVSNATTKVFEVTIDPANVVTATAVAQTFTVAGLTTNMMVGSFCMPSLETGLTITNCHVSATNTLKLTFGNPTVADINPASQTLKVVIL